MRKIIYGKLGEKRIFFVSGGGIKRAKELVAEMTSSICPNLSKEEITKFVESLEFLRSAPVSCVLVGEEEIRALVKKTI